MYEAAFPVFKQNIQYLSITHTVWSRGDLFKKIQLKNTHNNLTSSLKKLPENKVITV